MRSKFPLSVTNQYQASTSGTAEHLLGGVAVHGELQVGAALVGVRRAETGVLAGAAGLVVGHLRRARAGVVDPVDGPAEPHRPPVGQRVVDARRSRARSRADARRPPPRTGRDRPGCGPGRAARTWAARSRPARAYLVKTSSAMARSRSCCGPVHGPDRPAAICSAMKRSSISCMRLPLSSGLISSFRSGSSTTSTPSRYRMRKAWGHAAHVSSRVAEVVPAAVKSGSARPARFPSKRVNSSLRRPLASSTPAPRTGSASITGAGSRQHGRQPRAPGRWPGRSTGPVPPRTTAPAGARGLPARPGPR